MRRSCRLLWLVLFTASNFQTSRTLSSRPYGDTPKNVASQMLQGAGPTTRESLNRFNLNSIEDIKKEWTCSFVTKATESDAKVFLKPRNERENFVDVVIVSFPRNKQAPGLGVQLEEISGGRQDGLGITMVTGVVPGGAAHCAMLDLLPGDVLSKVTNTRKTVQDMTETEQQFSVLTECLDYDGTVAAIQSLPVVETDPSCSDTYTLIVKRLRRKPIVNVHLQYPPNQQDAQDTTIQLFAGENLRQAMLVRGVKLNDPLAKRFDTKTGGNCGAGGLCRTCAVSVLAGKELLNPQRVAEQQMLADAPRWRLA